MPSARTSSRDYDAKADAVAQQFALLVKALTHKDLSGDDFLQAFQEVDRRGKGYLSSKSDAIDVICDAITPKYQRRLDFDLLLKTFRTKHDRFDYTAFCEAFEKHRRQQADDEKPLTSSKKSHNQQPLKSPLGSPHKRSNWVIDQQQRGADSMDSPRETNGALQKMRLDPRLETQRLLSQSIRRKLLHGAMGTHTEGYHGIQEVLFHLDDTGEGFLEEKAFERGLLRRLKKPLTKQETQFLLANLRVRADPDSDKKLIHYDHLASFCNLDSDASADETDDHPSHPSASFSLPSSPSRDSQALGADFLAAEKNLRLFFQQTMASAEPTGKASAFDTPRSIVTGAEQFLEYAEALDTLQTGYLTEHDFSRLFAKCRLNIPSGLVRAMLTRFPRSGEDKISYRAFLERYGERPELARERRKLKRLLVAVLLPLKSREANDWIQFLTQRLEKYDTRLHTRCRGDVPAEQFVHTLRGGSSSSSATSSLVPVKLSVDVASDILAQFLRVSRVSSASAVLYNEFLRILRDCYAQTLESSAEASRQPVFKGVPRSQSTGSSSSAAAVHNVADYLIHEASADEQQHFEELMEVLHKFQQRVVKKAINGKRSTDLHSPRHNKTSAEDQEELLQHGKATHTATSSEPTATSSEPTATLQAGAMLPIENGIAMCLGAKLQVRIQFTIV